MWRVGRDVVAFVIVSLVSGFRPVVHPGAWRGGPQRVLEDGRVSDAELVELAKAAVRQGNRLTPRESSELERRMRTSAMVGDLAWAYAKAGGREGLGAAQRRARRAAEERWSPRQASLMAWALAKGGALGRDAAGALGTAICQRSEEANGRDWSTIAWALATAGRQHIPAGSEACRYAASRDLEPESAACLAWALVTLERRGLKAAESKALVSRAMVAIFNGKVNGLKRPKSVALAAWAAASTSAPVVGAARPWLSRAAVHAADDRGLSPRDAAQILWAVGVLGKPEASAVEALARAVPRLDPWSPQAATNALWGLAKAGVAAPSARLAATTLIDRLDLDRCSARDVADAAWALSQLGMRHDDFLDSTRAFVKAARPASLSQFAIAYDAFGHPGINDAAERFVAIVDDCDDHQLAAIAAAVARHAEPEAKRRVLNALGRVATVRRHLRARDLVALVVALAPSDARLASALATRAAPQLHDLSPKQRADIARALLASRARSDHPFLLAMDSFAAQAHADTTAYLLLDDPDTTVELRALVPATDVYPRPPDDDVVCS